MSTVDCRSVERFGRVFFRVVVHCALCTVHRTVHSPVHGAPVDCRYMPSMTCTCTLYLYWYNKMGWQCAVCSVYVDCRLHVPGGSGTSASPYTVLSLVEYCWPDIIRISNNTSHESFVTHSIKRQELSKRHLLFLENVLLP